MPHVTHLCIIPFGVRRGLSLESETPFMFTLARTVNGKPAFARGADQDVSHLGPGLTATGLFETDGELYVYGAISGRVDAARLIIAPGGVVDGDVVAQDVRIAGRFSGRIFAPHVTIDETGNVKGRVFHTTVTVAHGARIDGRMPWRPQSYFETLKELPETYA